MNADMDFKAPEVLRTHLHEDVDGVFGYTNVYDEFYNLLCVDIRETNIRSDVFTAEFAKEYGVLVESGTHFVGNG